MAKEYVQLFTDDKLDDIPLKEYPRPQLKRDSYLSLNGEWEFEISKNESLPKEYNQEIIVPYPVESYLSKINKPVQKDDYLFYKKEFFLDKNFIKDKVLLHLDGIDQVCWIYLNGKKIMTHCGGYIPFEIDIKPYLQEKNILEVKVKDDLNHLYPYGKQKEKRGGMWYTPCSGIWKSVWIESVYDNYIKSIKITPSLNDVLIQVDGGEDSKTIIYNDGSQEKTLSFNGNKIKIQFDSPKLWSPEEPNLYDFKIISGKDEICSYFALRTLSIKEYKGHKVFFLNDKPYFFHGVLDQGYYPDGNLTPRSYFEYEKDILTMKELGFNTLRKHIKIEPLYFYYLCDKLGMVVFQDMVNNKDYNLFHDGILPLILGLTRLNDKNRFKKEENDVFIDEMKKSLSLLYNCPCICLWTIFNEGWGQSDSYIAYKELLKIDQTRLVDVESGWFTNVNELDSKHIYFKKVKMKYNNKVLYLSEFGGYEYSVQDHRFNPYHKYGYKHFTSQQSLQEGITSLYEKEIIPLIKQEGLSSSIYTQLSDIEDETNGLLTYDRKVIKVNKESMNKIAKQMKF